MPVAVEKNRLLSWKLNFIIHFVKPEIGLFAVLGWTVEDLHKRVVAVKRSVPISPRSVAKLRPESEFGQACLQKSRAGSRGVCVVMSWGYLETTVMSAERAAVTQLHASKRRQGQAERDMPAFCYILQRESCLTRFLSAPRNRFRLPRPVHSTTKPPRAHIRCL